MRKWLRKHSIISFEPSNVNYSQFQHSRQLRRGICRGWVDWIFQIWISWTFLIVFFFINTKSVKLNSYRPPCFYCLISYDQNNSWINFWSLDLKAIRFSLHPYEQECQSLTIQIQIVIFVSLVPEKDVGGRKMCRKHPA